MRICESFILDDSRTPVIRSACERWRGTPYSETTYAIGNGVNCVNLVAGVFDDLFSWPTRTILPPLGGLDAHHRPHLAVEVVRTLRRAWFGSDRVWSGPIEPGDVIVTRNTKCDSGGPVAGHIIIVAGRDWLYHAMNPRGAVSHASHQLDREVLKVFRPRRTEAWRT